MWIRDGRANPLMDRKVLEVSSLSLSFSDYLLAYQPIFYVCMYVSICLSIYLSISLSLFDLSICLAVYLSIYLCIYPSVYLFIYLSIYLSVYLSIYRSIYLSVYLSTYLSIYLSIYLFIYLSIYLSVCLAIWTSKSGPKLVCLYILTWKCASRHNGVHFFDIATSKSGPTLVFCTFWLANVLRATKACTFSTLQLPKVVRRWCVLYILTWKCASRHNGVHFFDIATSKSGPTLVCFVHFDLEMCFAPQRCAIFHLSSGQLAPHPPL